MKKFILRFVFGCFLTFFISQLCLGQNRKWDFGVSAELGRDYYDRRYPAFYDKYSGLLRSFVSNYSWGMGIWTEKHLNRSFSGLARINYMQQDIHPDIYGEPSSTGRSFNKEKHHHIIADIGGRWYVNPNSKIKIFVDAKMGANAFLAIDLYEYNDGKSTNKNIFGYDRWQPVAAGAAGVNWKRIALMLEYNRDLKRAEKHGYDTNILRQGLTVKTSFAIIKPH